MRKIIILLIIILSFSTIALAQDNGFNFGLNLGLGTIVYNGSTYQTLSLKPDLAFGKFGIGLDIFLMFDQDFNIVPDNWDSFTDWMNKILYIRYGLKGEQLYAQIGMFKNVTLGHGLIMYSYTNMLYFPEIRKLGFELDLDGAIFNFPYLGFESFIDNLLDPDIMAFRLYSRPLMFLDIPIISAMKVGVSYAIDTDPMETKTDDMNLADNPASTSSVGIFGVDIEFPLLQKDLAFIYLYGDWASISGKGSGAEIGLNSYLLKLFYIGLAIDMFGDKFSGQYFDILYENYEVRNNKYQLLDSITATTSWRAFASLLIGQEIFSLYFEMRGDFSPNPVTLIGILKLDKSVLKIISISGMFIRSGITSFSDLFNWQGTALLNSYLMLNVTLNVGDTSSITLVYQVTWDADGNPIASTQLQTGLSFNF
ncbi:MAG: hypothetical protein WH035_00515 [Spirochaetota bacterium]